MGLSVVAPRRQLTLQWGRGGKASEIQSLIGGCVDGEAASMGPRRESLGNGIVRRGRLGAELMLQWGRGGKASEIQVAPPSTPWQAKLQWGRGGKASEIVR